MNNTAMVNRIEGNDIYLMHMSDYGKKEKTEREFWNIKKHDFKVDNPEGFDLNIGDAVEYFIPTGKTIGASFLVLVLPLVVFLSTFALLQFLGLKSEKICALLSTATMMSSFFITKLLKKAGIKETLPHIIEIISKESLAELKASRKDCGSCTACD